MEGTGSWEASSSCIQSGQFLFEGEEKVWFGK